MQTGRVFVSYRRSRASEVAGLVSALRERGVPTWQDLSNLENTHTEEELKRVLDSDDISGAVVWLSPDVETSDVIRKIELPKIVKRETAGSGFYVVPVLAGGLDYKNVGSVCGAYVGAENLGAWNLHRLTNDPAIASDCQAVAKKVLDRRLKTFAQGLPADAPLDAQFYVRVPPPAIPAGLTIDWRHHFQGRHAVETVWTETLLPALEDVASSIGTHMGGRKISFRGKVPLSATFALGSTMPSTRGIKAEWVQEFPSGEEQAWNLAASRVACGFTSTQRGNDATGRDIALLISITQDVEAAFAASRSTLPALRAVVKIEKKGATTTHLTNPGEALDLAWIVREAVLGAKREYPDAQRLHVFMAAPAGLAFLMGQLSNTFGPIQLYELDQSKAATGTYCPSASING